MERQRLRLTCHGWLAGDTGSQVCAGFGSNCSWMGAVELSTCCLQVTLLLRCVLGLDLTVAGWEQ